MSIGREINTLIAWKLTTIEPLILIQWAGSQREEPNNLSRASKDKDSHGMVYVAKQSLVMRAVACHC